MRRFGWSALLIATVASCGYDELEGAGEAVEQVSSAVVYDGHDFYFFRQQASWTGAKAVACPDSYRLARINSAAENAFIRDEAYRHGTLGENSIWWIGYTDQTAEGTWVWENGEDPGYVNWAPGEPRNVTGNEDYAALDTSTGKWSARANSAFTNFICERNDVPTTATSSFTYRVGLTNDATRDPFQWAVNLKRNNRITFGTCGITTAAFQGDTFLRFFSPAGVQLSYNDDACGSGIRGSNISYLVPSNGTYYIHAGCYGETTCGGNPVVIRTECSGICG